MKSPEQANSENQDRNTPKREWVRNPNGSPEIYSNFIHSSWTLYDTRIIFGHLKPATATETFIVEEQGAVTLTWAQTKNLAVLLADMVRAYESVNPTIETPTLAPRHEDIVK